MAAAAGTAAAAAATAAATAAIQQQAGSSRCRCGAAWPDAPALARRLPRPHLQLRRLLGGRVERAEGDHALGRLEPAVRPHVPRHAHCRAPSTHRQDGGSVAGRRAKAWPALGIAGHDGSRSTSSGHPNDNVTHTMQLMQTGNKLAHALHWPAARQTSTSRQGRQRRRRRPCRRRPNCPCPGRAGAPPSISSSSANSACAREGAVGVGAGRREPEGGWKRRAGRVPRSPSCHVALRPPPVHCLLPVHARGLRSSPSKVVATKERGAWPVPPCVDQARPMGRDQSPESAWQPGGLHGTRTACTPVPVDWCGGTLVHVSTLPLQPPPGQHLRTLF